MSFITAFKTAWKDLKSDFTKVDTFLIANEPKIQSAIQTGVAITEALVPAAAPVLTTLDAFEETAVPELLATIAAGNAVVNATSGTAAVTLSAGLYSSLKTLVGTLSNHPAVVAATAPATTPTA
jgi:hypothetical protein